MSKQIYTAGRPFEFDLQTAGCYGERRTASDVATGHDHVLAILLRDHYCPRSRQFVVTLADRYESFAGRATAVVPVLPDRRERAAVWQRRYDLPFELLADTGDGSTDDTGFGDFAPFEQLIQALPGAVLFDADGEDELRFVRTVDRDGLADESAVESLIGVVDEHRAKQVAQPMEPGVNAEFAGGN